MNLLFLAYLAAILSILSPCILPVLPFVFCRADQPFLRTGLPLLIGMNQSAPTWRQPYRGVMTMKMKYAITTFAALAAAAPLFVAAASAEDTMKPEASTQDHMKGEAMKGDATKGDHMGSGAMGNSQK